MGDDVAVPGFHDGFEDPAALATAALSGQVGISRREPYRGTACLQLTRAKADMEREVTRAVLPAFAVRDGVWDVAVAMRSRLHSPDSSYNGTIWLETLDAAGAVRNRFEIAIATGDSPWRPLRKRLELAGGPAAARFVIAIEKTWGEFAVDELTAVFAGPSRRSLQAIRFASEAVGNLFLPGQPLRFAVTAVCTRPRPAALRTVTCIVRDYWGAEQATVAIALAEAAPDELGRPTYRGQLELPATDLEVGRYYELHGEMAEPGLPEPARDASSFAILPEAETRRHPPFAVPFTASGWNPGVPGFFPLCDRLGLRVANVYSSWSSTPPYDWTAPGIEIVRQLGMGALLSTPVLHVEARRKGWEAYDETALREGARRLVAELGRQVPIAVRVGNEPHPVDDDDVRRMIGVYRAVYQGAKSADPSVVVTATSCGPEEAFFRLGYQDTHDVYIFHQYADAQVIHGDFARYRQLVAKHGGGKPIWSTELGLNSQGMSRSAVAIQLIKIFTNFFACGGANASWFGIMWPDPDGSNVGTNGDSFDVFNSKYCLYSPKLTAIAQYHMVNGICVKSFVAQRTYPDGTILSLFRDRDAGCLLVAWNDAGRTDVGLPLPGIGSVRATRLDGAGGDFAPAGALTLGLSEEPYLLSFVSASFQLPEALVRPAAGIDGGIAPVVKGGCVRLALRASDPDAIELFAPPGWTVRREPAGPGMAAFAVTAAADTAAREGRLLARLGPAVGEIQVPVPVVDAIDIRFVPAPRGADGSAGMMVHLANRGPATQPVRWSVAIPATYAMANGAFRLGEPDGFAPSFTTPAAGAVELAPGASTAIAVRAANLDPLALYGARLELADGSRTVSRERLFGGCAGVPRIGGGVRFDGRFGDPAWRLSPLLRLDQPGQFAIINRATARWDGPQDLSGTMRLLWDDAFLYLGMEVLDDVFCQPEVDSNIWRGDGLQFLVDPCRESGEKPGKYDYAVALSAKGAQAWCYSSADAVRAPSEEVRDFTLRITPTGTRGNVNYEIAIPWHRLSPFVPRPGGNLGLGMIINNDDGRIRDSFMAWFGCAHSKQLSMNGDLILLG